MTELTRKMRRMTRLTGLLLFSLCIANVHADDKFGNEKAITPARLKANLEFIASDELEGRDTPSRGLDIATLYVSTQLKLWGATPAGDDGTFFQKIRLSQRSLDTANSAISFGGATYTFGDGFKAADRSGPASGPLVYVGHGLMLKSKGIDPYAGLDVKGKILVVAFGLPKGVSRQDLTGTEGTDYMDARFAAKKLGAAGVLTVPDSRYLSRWNAERARRVSGLNPEKTETAVAASTEIPEVFIAPALADQIFAGESVTAADAAKGVDAPEKGFNFAPSKVIQVNVVEKTEVSYARNVVAVVPGTDSKLKSEYVAFGAHIDHIGMRTTGAGDRINNGADDDGSGTVSILEIAHALLTGPKPKRSCLFVWHIGEEKGLWGSEYYTDNPTVPLASIVTQLNIDMIGRSRPEGDTKSSNAVLTGANEIYVVGSTKMSTDLQKSSEKVNADFLNIKFNYKYDDPKDTENIFYRSDHYNYARKGIPIIFYFDGVHEDYHGVGDEVSKIDFDKMSRVARTVFATGWTLANAKGRPVVDKPLKQ